MYSKKLQKRKKFSFAASAHRKTVNLFRCCGFCPALENFQWAPMPMGVSRETGSDRISSPMEFETDDVIQSSPVNSGGAKRGPAGAMPPLSEAWPLLGPLTFYRQRVRT